MMDKQKRESPPFTSPSGRSNGFKIPKKKPDDWCEDFETSSPLTRLAKSDFGNVTIRKRPFASSYESYNVPRNKEAHTYYSSSGSYKFTRTEHILSLQKEVEKEPEAKSSEKRVSLEPKEQAQKRLMSSVCQDVSNTSVSTQKDLNFGVKKSSTEDRGDNKNSLKNNIGSPNIREKTYCYKRAEHQSKKSPPTNVSVPSAKNKPSPSSSESATDRLLKSSESNMGDSVSRTSKESKKSSLNSSSPSPPVITSSSNRNRLSRKKMHRQNASKGSLPLEPIVVSSDEEEREREEHVILEQTLAETSVEMKEDNVCDIQCPSPCDDVEPMDCSAAVVDCPTSEKSVLLLKCLNVYYGKKKGKATGCAKLTPSSIEIPLKVPLEQSTCISLDTMKLQKYGLWLTSGEVPVRCSAVIILWITTDYVPHIVKQMGAVPRNPASKSNELIFLELVVPLTGSEQSLMCRIMEEASKNGLPTLADILTWNEIQSMLADLSNEDCSFRANCGIAFKIQQQQESSNTFSSADPPEESKVTSSYTLLQRYREGRHSVSMVPRQDDTLKEVDKGGTLIRLLVYPPPPTKGGLAVTNEDLECLEHGEFLNDVIIDFYLKYLLLEKYPKNLAEKCHVFSSFFFRCLTRKDNVTNYSNPEIPAAQRRHYRVKNWTRHVDIFAKDFIFVPVNENSHWYLIVICFPWLEKAVYEDQKEPSTIQDFENKIGSNSGSVIVFNDHLSKKEETLGEGSNSESEGSTGSETSCNPKHSKQKDEHHGKLCKRPCLLIFDSLKIGSAHTTVQVLREYLKAEWDVKRKTPREFSRSSMRDLYPKVPKQNNSTDCGLYVLQYVESFAQKPIESFDPPMHLENWFPASAVKHKRDKIRDLILRLHMQQSKKS
ncbi:sentrin-specific protease 7 isoform X2 [Bufo gargarizans]|uniref:sentrin-specific protease 7 isoform X2 n=1 Tax=Bufo gargarizans TaxID=30331 RepID=UPI001CF57B7F|nr:sentrin-specific protease 7 isoform X2 [Bufo gargarizans]